MMGHAEEHILSAAALIAAASLGLTIIAAPARAVNRSTSPAAAPDPTPPCLFAPIDARVISVSNAIAIGEGYYAPGEHDGRSLPFKLNNPGALKQPALGAADLPTWKDTGLVIFPTEAMGWAALHHQVRGMLTGTSVIYEPSDTLADVGLKYADGDPNWAVNVAGLLGVPIEATLADLAVVSHVSHGR